MSEDSRPSHLSAISVLRICLENTPTGFDHHPTGGPFSLLRHAIAQFARCRNINLLPIDYASRPRLRVLTNPEGTNLAQETLGIRRAGFSPAYTLLIPAESLLDTPATLTSDLQRRRECSLTTRQVRRPVASAASAHGLSPDLLSARDRLTSELLRTL